LTLEESQNDHFHDKMFCRYCKKRVNISTRKALIAETNDGYFFIYCEKCWMEIEEVNDDDYTNHKFGE